MRTAHTDDALSRGSSAALDCELTDDELNEREARLRDLQALLREIAVDAGPESGTD